MAVVVGAVVAVVVVIAIAGIMAAVVTAAVAALWWVGAVALALAVAVNQQPTKSVGGNGVRNGNDDSNNDDNKNFGSSAETRPLTTCELLSLTWSNVRSL